MINTKRIVPVKETDLLTLYGTILKIASVNVGALESDGIGEFVVAENSKTLIANEPVVSVDFGSGVSASTVYFLAASNFKGFTAEGAAVTTTGEVEKGSATLYTATLSSGSVTIAKVGF